MNSRGHGVKSSRAPILVLFCSALAATACSTAKSLPFFPIGLYQVNDPSAIGSLREEGFNAVQTYATDPESIAALAKACWGADFKLLASPKELLASTVSVQSFPMVAWYLFDEPDVHGMAPETLASLDRKVRAWASETPTAFVMGDGQAAARYAASGDILMVDWYPVPHLPLESLGNQVRITLEAAKGKPVWAVIQAMNWQDYPQRDPKKPRVGRFPTASEIRFMTYDAIVQGAQGIWYFSYARPSGGTLADTPEEWFAVTETSRELAALRPILEHGRPINPPFPTNPNGLLARAWRYRGRDYIIVVNRKRDMMQPLPDALIKSEWRPLFEMRRDPRDLLQKSGGGWYLPPYRVLVFESRFRWK